MTRLDQDSFFIECHVNDGHGVAQSEEDPHVRAFATCSCARVVSSESDVSYVSPIPRNIETLGQLLDEAGSREVKTPFGRTHRLRSRTRRRVKRERHDALPWCCWSSSFWPRSRGHRRYSSTTRPENTDPNNTTRCRHAVTPTFCSQ